VEADLGLLVEFERNRSARIEIVFLEIVEEEVPLIDAPQIFRLVPIAADLVSGNDVEALADKRQVLVRLDSEAGSGDAEKSNHIPVKFIIGKIEPMNAMPEIFAAVQEVPGA